MSCATAARTSSSTSAKAAARDGFISLMRSRIGNSNLLTGEEGQRLSLYVRRHLFIFGIFWFILTREPNTVLLRGRVLRRLRARTFPGEGRNAAGPALQPGPQGEEECASFGCRGTLFDRTYFEFKPYYKNTHVPIYVNGVLTFETQTQTATGRPKFLSNRSPEDRHRRGPQEGEQVVGGRYGGL